VIALSAIRRERRATLMGLDSQDELEDIDAREGNYGASGIPGHWDGVIPNDGPHWPGTLDDASKGE
jgi:hypothetical protein